MKTTQPPVWLCWKARSRDVPHSEYDALERRIQALEALGEHCNSPEDRRLDNLLRKFARSVELTAWLGGWGIKIAPVMAALWFGGEQAAEWAKSFLQSIWPGQ